MSNKNYNFEIIERIRREIDLENGKILINKVVFTKHVTRSGFLAWLMFVAQKRDCYYQSVSSA